MDGIEAAQLVRDAGGFGGVLLRHNYSFPRTRKTRYTILIWPCLPASLYGTSSPDSRKENAMTAAAMVRTPLAPEGLTFWEELSAQCDRYTAIINGAISAQSFAQGQLLECRHGREIQIRKPAPPSASARLAIDFFSWGPVIRGKVSGSLDEWEAPIARDLDGEVVAVLGEGRSFSPKDLARYVVQGFRCYYPSVSLPYDC